MELTLHYGNGSSSGSDVYLDNHANSDFSDVRFTEDDGETQLDYWIQGYTENDSATVWVKSSSASAGGRHPVSRRTASACRVRLTRPMLVPGGRFPARACG